MVYSNKSFLTRSRMTHASACRTGSSERKHLTFIFHYLWRIRHNEYTQIWPWAGDVQTMWKWVKNGNAAIGSREFFLWLFVKHITCKTPLLTAVSVKLTAGHTYRCLLVAMNYHSQGPVTQPSNRNFKLNALSQEWWLRQPIRRWHFPPANQWGGETVELGYCWFKGIMLQALVILPPKWPSHMCNEVFETCKEIYHTPPEQ